MNKKYKSPILFWIYEDQYVCESVLSEIQKRRLKIKCSLRIEKI